MQFVSVLLGNLTIFGGPELLKISRTIDLSCQSIGYAWARAVWQQRRRQVTFCGLHSGGVAAGVGGAVHPLGGRQNSDLQLIDREMYHLPQNILCVMNSAQMSMNTS